MVSSKFALTRLHWSSLIFCFMWQLTLLVTLMSHVCSSQEAPMDGAPKMFETHPTNKTYRTNVCDRQQQIFDGTIELRDALKGLNLNVHTNNDTELDLFSLDDEGLLPPKNSSELGLTALILDELAERAGFTWRDSFATDLPLDDETIDVNKTYTDLLVWSFTTYDIAANVWGKSSGRIAKGANYVEYFYDNSLIIITKPDAGSKNIFSFLRPFDTFVWLSVALSIFLTGLLYTLILRFESDGDESLRHDMPLTSIFLSAMTFAGHFEFQPNSHAARLMSLSWSFWTLITISAYTANLASFMVSRKIPVAPISTIEEIVIHGQKVCIWQKTVHEDILSKKYPSLMKSDLVVRKDKAFQILEGIKDEDCKVGIIGKSDYEKYKRDKNLNKDCNLHSVGSIVHPVPSGLVTSIDTGEYCTSLVTYVLDLHMNEMKTSQSTSATKNYEEIPSRYQEIMESYLGRDSQGRERNSTNSCDSSNSSTKSKIEESTTMGMDDIGGISVLHFCACSISLCLAIGQYIWKRRKSNQTSKETNNEENCRRNKDQCKSIWVVRDPIDSFVPPENDVDPEIELLRKGPSANIDLSK